MLSIDTAHVPGPRNSSSVVLTWRSFGLHHFLVDVWRDQVRHDDLERQVHQIIARYRPSAVLIEAGDLGPALAVSLSRRAYSEGFTVQLVPTGNQSKSARFSDVVPLIKAGSIHLPSDALWASAYVEELCAMPDCLDDDQADATAMYIKWAQTHPSVKQRSDRSYDCVVSYRGQVFDIGTLRRLLPIRRGYVWSPRPRPTSMP